MATLADGGRITIELVEEEIARYKAANNVNTSSLSEDTIDISELISNDIYNSLDEFELVQLSHVVKVCKESSSAAAAAKRLFANSIKEKSSTNNSDRLVKYLAKFGLKFKQIGNNS